VYRVAAGGDRRSQDEEEACDHQLRGSAKHNDKISYQPPGYGEAASDMISHSVTPYDHTSDSVVNVLSRIASGDIQRHGRLRF
jgi:hypothetical protein